MTLRAPQNETSITAPLPTAYDENLLIRCFPHKFRKVGDPYSYLDAIGVHAMVEFICKGYLLIDVAEATDVPLMTLRHWIEMRGYFDVIGEAETLSAEGYLAEGMKRIRNAPTEFELRRAQAMVKQAQFMAAKKNKPLYGDSVKLGAGEQVQFIFNVGNRTEAVNLAENMADRIIEGTATKEPKSVSVDLKAALTPPPMKLVLVADRPEQPTAATPDIGPFFDEVPDHD